MPQESRDVPQESRDVISMVCTYANKMYTYVPNEFLFSYPPPYPHFNQVLVKKYNEALYFFTSTCRYYVKTGKIGQNATVALTKF